MNSRVDRAGYCSHKGQPKERRIGPYDRLRKIPFAHKTQARACEIQEIGGLSRSLPVEPACAPDFCRATVAGLLGGHAKAMVVTGSRKEAVRYKLGFDQYVKLRSYRGLSAMIAFSGDVQFSPQDPNAEALLGGSYTEVSMNPDLKGRDLRKAFDSDDFNVMIVANKFQTGFDQPKLCAMCVDKKLAGVECVQTLSRLNRIYPGKEETYVLDFFNDPDDVLAAFQEYYETAALLDVSDPEHIWLLHEKLSGSSIFLMSEVNRFADVFYARTKSQAAISNVCKPAVDRWQTRYADARQQATRHRELLARAKLTGDAVLIGNADSELKGSTRALNALEDFKKDLMSFVRYYEFMSQIVDYDSTDLEKLSLYARHLAPLLREMQPDEEAVDLSTVELSHYRLSKIKQQDLTLARGIGEGLTPGSEVGTSKAKSKQEAFLSQIIRRLNETFITDGLTENDVLDYARTIANKVGENAAVTQQIQNNSAEQAMLGDFANALDNAVMESGDAHQNQMNQVLSDKAVAASFGRIVFDLLVAQMQERHPTAAPRAAGRN